MHSELMRDARRRFFDNLLVAALHSTVAFVHVDVVAQFVTKDLNFDMAWMHDVLLHDHVVIVEALHSLALSCV